MKKFKSAIIIILTLFSFLYSNGQQQTVLRGRVIDALDKTTIIGANVIEYDSEERVVNGTITNVNGDFVLQMKDPSNVVKVSVIGYKIQEIAVKTDQSIMVAMESDDVAIGEVVVTAEARSSTGLTNIADRDKASSSVKVDLMDMQDAGVLSAADALQGKVSGLDIIAASGDPGSGSQLVIRGLSSMGNNQPLIVIDGIPQFRVSSSFDLTSADTEDISNLINVALQDIKSIEVLKDAASTAVYGSQGADGVLLIETHRGKMGRVQFDYQYRNNINVQPPAIPMLNGDEYIMQQLEAWHNSRGVYDIPPEIAYDRDYIDFYNYSANTDWLEEITQNGMSQDHYFSVSGGGEKTRYFTSFSYLDEGGTTINTSYKRFSSRVNLDYFLSRNLIFQIKFNYTSSTREANLNVGGRNIRSMAYIKAPNMSIYELDEMGNPTNEYFNPITSYQGDGVGFFNPVAVANLGKNDTFTNGLDNTFTLQYRFKDWLTFRETISFQYQGGKSKTFLPYNAIGSDWLHSQVNSANESNNLNQQIRTETQIAFGSPFKNKDHEFSGALTWVTEQGASEWMGVMSLRSPSVNIQDPAAAPAIWAMWDGNNERRLVRSVNNLNYKWLDRYLFQGVLTLDGHSSFGPNNRFGLFKGVFLGWRFSNEPFLESLTWLNESMIRGSWGVSGRQPGDVYARFANYESAGNYMENVAISPSSIELSQLRWETISSVDVGIELNLLDDRVFFETNVYQKQTKDILFNGYNIPSSSGYSSLKYFNAGGMSNKGWEVMTDVKILRKKDLLWSMNFNASANVNSFHDLPDNFVTERSTSIGNGQYPLRVKEGEPIGSFFGFRYLGVWAKDEDVVAKDADGNILRDNEGVPIPFRYTDTYTFQGGDPIYEDINHDGKIDLNDVVYIGDSNPRFIGGFGSLVKYKNWDLSASFHYRLGFDIINNIALQTQGMNNRNNQSKATLHRWRIQGQDYENMLPKAYMNHPANNLGSDRYVEKGDYVRLNNLKIAYRLSQSMCKKIGVRKADIALSGRKLYTFTNYSGQDPEIGQDASNPFWIGVDNARTPPPKVYTISLSIGF
ncbi:MAG: SusC/RagA family TonB-linked outer membrane protein [Mariniphaga sp.]|nr:SusC/RagA family TonB-linked outer membrane protein [Mariniphaga sp.]MDD4227059.1 SusC/RagA family TonB-linked outer membrane protein [Mariniphaga sp.]